MVLLDLDPSQVPPPGWLPLVLVIVLLLVIGLLYLSMRRHIARLSDQPVNNPLPSEDDPEVADSPID